MTTPKKPARAPGKAPRKTGATFDTVRAIALALPGVEEGTSYGTPAFKAGGKLLARLREDGETLVVRVDMDARDLLMRSDPETFFITDHYAAYPAVLVRLPRVERGPLALLLEEAWRSFAPARLVAGGRRPKAASPGGAPPAPAPAPARSSKPRRSPSSTPPAPAPAPARSSKPRRSPSKKAPADPLARLRSICLALPEAVEGINHSRPCFEVGGKTFVMFMDNHHGDGRVAIWCKARPGAQAMIVDSDPRRFFVPPYVGPRGWIGARLDVDVDWSALEACVEESYGMTVPKRIAAKHGR